MTGNRSSHDLGQLHDVLADQPTLEIADALTDQLRTRDLPVDQLRQVGRWLTEHGTRRHAVATGIVLLGLAGDPRDRDVLLLLGALEDLTLYAVVALRRSQPDHDQATFQLAQRVDGWGRIHCVERLDRTNDPEIKAWLLRAGFRNGVMNDYLAHLAATTGDLYAALLEPDVDDALLDGAGDILDALCSVGGPAKDIRAYPDGPAVIHRYLDVLRHRAPTIGRTRAVLGLAWFLQSDDAEALDWNGAAHEAAHEKARAFTAQPTCRTVIEDALDSPDLRTFEQAIWPASQLRIPTRQRVRGRLHTHPRDAYLWQALLDDSPAEEIADIVALAERLLPLADLATGPSKDIGIGPFDAPDHVLDLIVSRLDAHPGHGWTLIKTALANRTIRNRNMAIRTLECWPPDLLPVEARDTVSDAFDAEPDTEVRRSLQNLLNTWRA